jgi:ABC-type amino acid transport substrate-binding protein
MTNQVRFDRDEYAKTYYKDYYQKNKQKINEARRKRITIERIETNYGVKLNDELYALYDENREIYNKVFKQLKQNKKNMITYTGVNPLLIEHFTNHIIV